MGFVNLCYLCLVYIFKKITRREQPEDFGGSLPSPSGMANMLAPRLRGHHAPKGSMLADLWWDLRGSAPAPSMQIHRRSPRAQTSKKLNEMANPSSSMLLLAVQQGASTHWPFLLGLRAHSQWSIHFYAIPFLFTTTLLENPCNEKNSLRLLQMQGQSLALNLQEIQFVSRHLIMFLWSLSVFCEFCPWKAQPLLCKQLEEGGT